MNAFSPGLPRHLADGLAAVLFLAATVLPGCSGCEDDAAPGGDPGGDQSDGCGGDTGGMPDSGPVSEDGGGGGGVDAAGGDTGSPGTDAGGTGDTPGDTGAGDDAGPVCRPFSWPCAAHGDCCSARCDLVAGVCLDPVGPCREAGVGCFSGLDCCTGICRDGLCAPGLCISDGQECARDVECCSGACSPSGDGGSGGTICLPLNLACRTAGNECGDDADCCSTLCDGGRCAGEVSFCRQTGDACATGDDCCTGLCTRAEPNAAFGVCTLPAAPGSTGCLIAGEVCGAGAPGAEQGEPVVCGGACCSRACAPYGVTGRLVCQRPSGCRPTGEACREDADCCGSAANPGGSSGRTTCSKAEDEAVGRCDNGTGCRPAGAICKLAVTSCNAENSCCAGNVNVDPTVCQQDLLGIPRCTGVGDCSTLDVELLRGQPCSTSADCCGAPCVPNEAGSEPPLVCGSACTSAGGACTTSADCCDELPCYLPPGSMVGVCGYSTPDDGAGP